jgi:hypothetical protein
MSVRCKVKCIETGESTDGANGPLHSAKFAAIYSANKESENGQFFRYTPHLELTLGVVSHQHFKVDQEYYLDFTPVAPPAYPVTPSASYVPTEQAAQPEAEAA